MAPLFVGSHSEVRSDRIGLAASTSDPGSANTGDAYYNTSDNALKIYSGSDWATAGGGGTLQLVASGAIADGAAVIAKTNGKVGIVTESILSTITFGSFVDIATNTKNANLKLSQIEQPHAVFIPDSNKIVLVYNDQDNTDRPTAVVVSVDGDTLTYGSPTVFNDHTTYYMDVTYDTSNDKVVIAFQDNETNNQGAAIVGEVVGNSIFFGDKVLFNANNNTGERMSITYDTNASKVLICYRDASVSDGRGIVGTVSGNSISFGSPVSFNSSNTEYIDSVYDINAQKHVIVFRDTGDSNKGKAVVATISGTSVSYGTVATFNGASTLYIRVAYDTANQKVLIVYEDDANSDYGTGIVGTVSGTDITFGSETVFESAAVQEIGVAYEENAGKFVTVYRDNGNSNYGTAVVGTISGTSVTFDTPVVFYEGNTVACNATYLPYFRKVAIFFKESGVKGISTLGILTKSNLTSGNFIGFSDGAYSDGQTATIQIAGSVDDAQSGLTTAKTYYVQNDGGISTTKGNPAVIAGTSLSDTQIIVQG